MPPELLSYSSWAQVNDGRSSTLAQLRDFLSRYSCSKVVYLCSVLNAFALDSLLSIREGPRPSIDPQAELLGQAFPPPIPERLVKASLNTANRVFVFHRQQLLLVAKEAILHCGEGGSTPFRSHIGAGWVPCS